MTSDWGRLTYGGPHPPTADKSWLSSSKKGDRSSTGLPGKGGKAPSSPSEEGTFSPWNGESQREKGRGDHLLLTGGSPIPEKEKASNLLYLSDEEKEGIRRPAGEGKPYLQGSRLATPPKKPKKNGGEGRERNPVRSVGRGHPERNPAFVF